MLSTCTSVFQLVPLALGLEQFVTPVYNCACIGLALRVAGYLVDCSSGSKTRAEHTYFSSLSTYTFVQSTEL